MAMDKIIRKSFPGWITDIYDRYNPQKQTHLFDEFRHPDGRYKPLNRIDWDSVYRKSRKIMKKYE